MRHADTLHPDQRGSSASAPARGEDGSAIVEFVFLTVVLLVPLVYLVLTIGAVQAGTYAVTQASREAGRAFVTAATADSAQGRAEAAAAIAFADFGFDGDLEVGCDGSPCLRPEARVTTRATVLVPLPLVPDFARSVVPLHIPVSSTSVASVDRFRAAP